MDENTQQPRFPDLKITLRGVEANTFGIVNRVSRVITELRGAAAGEEFKNAAWRAVRAIRRAEAEQGRVAFSTVNFATAQAAERVAREWVVIGNIEL